MGERHTRLWKWFDALAPGTKPDARVEVWGRGGAKSSTAELATAYVGCKLSRRFVLYVSETQDQADRHVQAIATLFERIGIDRSVNKHGNSKGWRRNQLRTANGFNVEALGLDVAARGIKLDEFRPDLIVFDDIDNQNDSPNGIEKKARSIKSSIIPAGSVDCAILFIQNLIHEFGIVASLVDDTADFLYNRDVPPIEPAARDLTTQKVDRGDGKMVYRVTGGVPTWEGQSLATIELQINEWGLQTFLREAQHEVHGADGKFFLVENFRYCDPDEVPDELRCARAWDLGATQAGGDPSAGVLGGRAESGVTYVIDVKREQYATNDVRSLIDRSAEADGKGEVYAEDEKARGGAFARQGALRFRFKPKGGVLLRLPQDPGQAGKSQAYDFETAYGDELLKIKPVTGRKAIRARGWQEQVNSGNVVLVRGDWNEAFVREHRLFREDEAHEKDDQVDASSDMHSELALPVRKTTAAAATPAPTSAYAGYRP